MAVVVALLASASWGCTMKFPLTDDQRRSAVMRTGLEYDPASNRERWWRENKDRAVFVPGKGFSVPGVEGYFDESGRKFEDDTIQQASYPSPQTDSREPIDFGFPDGTPSNGISSTVNAVKRAVGQGPNETVAREFFTQGEALFRRQEYGEAAENFAGAAKRFPDSPLEHDAMFWHAESLFFADRYPDAIEAIQRLVKKYPGTRYLDKVMQREYSIARYWQLRYDEDPQWPITPNVTDSTRTRFDTLGHAMRAYEHIRLSDPTGDYADDALLATAHANFRRGKYVDADYYYGLLRSEYPKSEHQKAAHLLGLEAKVRKYQGPDYDGQSLDEAAELAKRTLTLFSSQDLGTEDQNRVLQMRAEIEAQQALRVWNRAEFYARRDYYGAAKFYYDRIVKEYPTTRMAEEARSRLAEYQGQPDTPTPPLEMLANAVGLGGPEAPTAPALSSSPSGPSSIGSMASRWWPFGRDDESSGPPSASLPAQAPGVSPGPDGTILR
jgi:outer membrane protein assembly factor BamD (BamD/ComL family)